MTRYINNVTGESQFHPPPKFCGGILADAMGLGKTLSIIALIASDFHGDNGSSDLYCDDMERPPNHYLALKTTLLVVPLLRELTILPAGVAS